MRQAVPRMPGNSAIRAIPAAVIVPVDETFVKETPFAEWLALVPKQTSEGGKQTPMQFRERYNCC